MAGVPDVLRHQPHERLFLPPDRMGPEYVLERSAKGAHDLGTRHMRDVHELLQSDYEVHGLRDVALILHAVAGRCVDDNHTIQSVGVQSRQSHRGLAAHAVAEKRESVDVVLVRVAYHVLCHLLEADAIAVVGLAVVAEVDQVAVSQPIYLRGSLAGQTHPWVLSDEAPVPSPTQQPVQEYHVLVHLGVVVGSDDEGLQVYRLSGAAFG